MPRLKGRGWKEQKVPNVAHFTVPETDKDEEEESRKTELQARRIDSRCSRRVELDGGDGSESMGKRNRGVRLQGGRLAVRG
jgi:hypothetical protein